MSVKLIARVLEHSRATGSDRLVLVTLAFFCNGKRGDSIAWPSLALLAKRVRLTVPGLCKSLKRLIGLGEITRERSSGGRNQRTRYIICVGNSKRVDTVSTAQNSIQGDRVSDVRNSKPQDSISGEPQTVSYRKRCPSGNGFLAGNETVSCSLHAITRNGTGNKSTESDRPIPDSLFSISNKEKDRKESDEQIPNPSPAHSKKRKRSAPDPAQLEAFAGFYEAYPRHVGRAEAEKAWLKLNPSPALTETILTAVARYTDEVSNTEPKYIKHPGPWLNAKRWEDEPGNSGSEDDAEWRRRTFVNG